MANTYIKIYLHIVFAVKNREALIPTGWQVRIHSYLKNSIREMGHVPISVGGVENHVHILISYSGKQPLPDLIRDLKINSTKFINKNGATRHHFFWQKGYACFSYSHSQIEAVNKYISNQHAHHKGRTLVDEMKHMLGGFGVEYDEQYLFYDA